MRIPPSFNFDLILDGGLYSWTNAGTSNFPTGCGAADLFALEVFAAPDGAGIVYQRVVDFSLTFNTTPYAWERKSADAGATFSTWQLVGPDEIVIPSPATPYSIIALHNNTTVLVTTGAGAFVCNLPAAAGVVGHRVTIVKIDSGVGVIQIAPNGADVIANAGNVSAYIGAQFRHITLQAQAAGQWDVVGGEWQPAQAVDTNGSHVSLGRLHRFAMNNVTARNVAVAGPGAGSWTAAIQITGLYGVPVGAKAIRVREQFIVTPSGVGGTVNIAAFSDNNTNVPTASTAHAGIYSAINTANQFAFGFEMDIQLNSAGECYLYEITRTTTTSVAFNFIILGYYMGD
jgi:hypothetical protein